MSDGLEIRAVRGMPEIHPGDDLAKLLIEAISGSGLALQDEDVLVVAQKVVSRLRGGSFLSTPSRPLNSPSTTPDAMRRTRAMLRWCSTNLGVSSAWTAVS
jgi:F420-0:gamma-glutamyl ligase